MAALIGASTLHPPDCCFRPLSEREALLLGLSSDPMAKTQSPCTSAAVLEAVPSAGDWDQRLGKGFVEEEKNAARAALEQE